MKRLLLILSFSAIVFGCDKHDGDYKNNIPNGKYDDVTEESVEYTLNDLADQWVGGKIPVYVQVDRFVQGYVTVTEADVSGRVSDRYYMDVFFDGSVLRGGPYKGDPCDDGFDEVADEYDDIYGADDATISEYVENPVIVCRNNIKFDIYVTKGDYDIDHPEGSSLNDMAIYSYNVRKKYKSLGKWTETHVVTEYQSMVDYNNSDREMIVATDSFMYIPLPTKAGVYSFRVVIKSGNSIVCDKLIENVSLSARK